MNNLLYIPLRTTKDVAIGEELRRVIKKEYFQSPNIFEADLSQISKVRKRIAQLKDQAVDKSSEVFLKQYYLQVVTLTKKFNNEIIVFEWYGTLGYKPSGPYRVRSLKFEQYNLIYQMGSLYSQLAFRENIHSDEGMKRICNYFQIAAGCFDNLNELTTADNFTVDEFSNDSLQFLKYLMLAQAQETIWQKSINSNMKQTVVVKLSIETSNLYLKCIEYGNKSEFIKLELVNHCYVKYYHFLSASNYRLSLISLEDAKYGEQVAYLRKSSEFSRKGMKYKKYVKDFIVEDLKGLNDMVETALKNAERENDLIYHKPIPNELPVIQGAFMVKTIVLEELLNPLKSDRLLFKELLPYMIIQIGLAYKERQDDFLLKKILEPLQALNKMMNHFLTERQLPASIDSLQKPENIPESIIQHSQDIIKYGGTQTIERLYDNILGLSSDCRDIHEGCLQRLTIEKEEDEFFQTKYGDKWIRQSGLTSEVLDLKIKSMEQYLIQADRADDIILTSYHDIKEYLELYNGGYQSLSEFIPDSVFKTLRPEISNILNDIRQALDETRELEDSRKRFLRTLETKAKDNNILPKLIEEYKTLVKNFGHVEITETSFELVFNNHLKLFSEDLEFVELSKQTQIGLESKIDTFNNLFIAKCSEKLKEPDERKDALQSLENVYSRYLQLITNINEATKFYNDFKTRGLKVIRECDDYISKRRQEARDLELVLSPGEEPISQPISESKFTYEEDYDSEEDERSSFGDGMITPVPIVPSPVPLARTDTPSNKELNELQKQFTHTLRKF